MAAGSKVNPSVVTDMVAGDERADVHEGRAHLEVVQPGVGLRVAGDGARGEVRHHVVLDAARAQQERAAQTCAAPNSVLLDLPSCILFNFSGSSSNLIASSVRVQGRESNRNGMEIAMVAIASREKPVLADRRAKQTDN